ncbi:MAG TPA: hypothetical protein VG722_04420 [Tepidisphaeraceae bacterium]|nr:hypothetical protein [Tepidisphaeraceae bacterium]
MKQQSTPKKPYWKMSADELAEVTKEFDRPLPPERFKPLSKAERARFERARRAGGLRVRRLYELGMDDELLDEAVEYARRKKLSVSQVVERGIRGLLAFDS